jgi:hypothetical protein
MPNKEQKKGCCKLCHELVGEYSICSAHQNGCPNHSPEKVEEDFNINGKAMKNGVLGEFEGYELAPSSLINFAPKHADWEIEYRKMIESVSQSGWFDCAGEEFVGDLKAFIHQTLLTQREEIIREIGEKMPTIRAENDNNPYIIGREEYCSEVKSLLKDLKNRV